MNILKFTDVMACETVGQARSWSSCPREGETVVIGGKHARVQGVVHDFDTGEIIVRLHFTGTMIVDVT